MQRWLTTTSRSAGPHVVLARLAAVSSPSTSSSHRLYKTMHVKPSEAAAGAAASRTLKPVASSCAEDQGPVKAKPLTALQRRMLAMKDKQEFTLTPLAYNRIRALLQQHNGGKADPDTHAIGIRVGVKRRGCSGYSYTINYALARDPNAKPDDRHVEQKGVHVYVDNDALFYVIGTVMDFTTTNVEEKFTFKNPNEKAACGCGESFMPFDV